MNTCKNACLRNCSCKSALFLSVLNSSTGDCYLPSEIFSLENNGKDRTQYYFQAFIKVQELEPATHIPKTFLSGAILGSIIGSSILGIIIGITVFIFWKKKRRANEEEADYLDHVPGMPTRYSYDDLKVKTENFTKNLGDRGFGIKNLIDRNQSQVMTMMRGTPGYLAPEWLSRVITEKVDVYSFRIMILEILGGRRHFKASEIEEERIMLNYSGKRQRKDSWWILLISIVKICSSTKKK
ncbi:hypothetical protein T459_20300 [Capsicum annuum]|uniref:Apple domain-containing protein n=1 Tax=Capsicum annuum TaxID=4072 RepID=A0A2G2Z449_CAPAN|nr:hypothetical protein T459_20300 [Capsicum annuum]